MATHDRDVCGLDDGGPASLCPGCRAEWPARQAAEARQQAKERRRSRRRRTRPAARAIARLLCDHPGLLRPLVAVVVRDVLVAELPAAVAYLRRAAP